MPGDEQAAQEALGDAVMADDPDAVARAVASDADVEAKVYHYVTGKMGGPYSDKTAVWLAAEHNKLRALRFLLAAAGADPNVDHARRHCARAQFRKTTDSSSGRLTPCYVACSFHHHDAIRILVALDARPDHHTGVCCTCPVDIPRLTDGRADGGGGGGSGGGGGGGGGDSMGFGAVAAASAPVPPPFACAGEPARASSASETPGEERMVMR